MVRLSLTASSFDDLASLLDMHYVAIEGQAMEDLLELLAEQQGGAF